MNVDWCDYRWSLLVPWDSPPHTHFVGFNAARSSRSDAITHAVLDWFERVPGSVLPSPSPWRIVHHHADWRRRTWRALYARGFRVVKVRVRAA